MTAVKICGLTREADVALACALGADAVGFNFVPSSVRRLTLETARRLVGETAGGVLRVGVFASEKTLVIRRAVEAAGLDVAQLHRPLREEDVDMLEVPVIAVATVGPGGPELPPVGRLARCRALLFDTLAADHAGGTGETFDWQIVAGRDFGLPIVLAGGLNAENVAEAVRRVRPWAVDVASGVESAPGIKDPEKMRRFILAVREADADAA
ncbi:MAG TPA: phosphoribosylanthranilate isomerase [Thermoanaerobaculia bacterium]|nr:phosphoribosylanthranilate isomerase [Thermoanaerobaculia bacterium]